MKRWSAPGKLMLLGEHAVVYGYPCLVTAVNQRISVAIEEQQSATTIQTTAGDTRFVDAALEIGCSVFGGKDKHFIVKINQAFSSQFGFGSSSAVTVATLAALADCLGKPVSQQALFETAFRVVETVQGVASGFDVAAAVYGRTIWYGQRGKDITRVPFTANTVAIVIGYTGVKADTATLVRQVGRLYNENKRQIELLFRKINALVIEAKKAIEAGDWSAFGQLCTENHTVLQELGVSTDRLDTLVKGALEAGAYGAKLSGAGGGDCMIALSPLDRVDAVKQAIEQCGGQIVDVEIDAEGVTQV